MSEPIPLERAPKPDSVEQAILAMQLGMIMLQGIKDIDEMQMFSGLTGAFSCEVSDSSGRHWTLMLAPA